MQIIVLGIYQNEHVLDDKFVFQHKYKHKTSAKAEQ